MNITARTRTQSVRDQLPPTGGAWVTRVRPTDANGDWLVVGGGPVAGPATRPADNEAAINTAAVDLVLRYWIHTRESGARRIGLTDCPIEPGPDPSLLP